MKISNIKRELFSRDKSSYENILDDYWTLKIPSVVRGDFRLISYFEFPEYSDLNISISGKDSGVNEAAFQTALSVLPDLHLFLAQCASNVDIHTDSGWWNLTSIWFPYQIEKMWYLHFTSEYGSDLEYCFIKNSQTNIYSGLVSGWRDNDSIAHVLPTVKYVVKELGIARLGCNAFSVINSRIESEETIGRELIIPLIDVVENNKGIIKEYMYKHLLKLLNEVKCNAIA